MKNPWEDIELDDYENHMNLNSVSQLPVLNRIISSQLSDYDTNSVCIFGIAGGNGLEHIDTNKYHKVYAIDINDSFLETTQKRFGNLMGGILECKKIDLIKEFDKLPNADLIIANLLVEYVGYESFQKTIQKVNPKFISCVIQIDINKNSWLSDSPYVKVFKNLDKVHHKIEEEILIDKMNEINYELIKNQGFDLPNGKKFIRFDFKK